MILLSDSLADPIASLNLIERRLLFAGLIALLFAAVTGYLVASVHAKRILRLERAAERIAGGRFDEPVVDTGNDELGDLADAFERMRHWMERGLTGLRLFTTGSTMPGQATWFADPRTYPAWEFAGEAGVPV